MKQSQSTRGCNSRKTSVFRHLYLGYEPGEEPAPSQSNRRNGTTRKGPVGKRRLSQKRCEFYKRYQSTRYYESRKTSVFRQSRKTVIGNDGAMPIDVPRDRTSHTCKHVLPVNGWQLRAAADPKRSDPEFKAVRAADQTIWGIV